MKGIRSDLLHFIQDAAHVARQGTTLHCIALQYTVLHLDGVWTQLRGDGFLHCGEVEGIDLIVIWRDVSGKAMAR